MKPCRLFRPGILKAAGTAALVLALTACSVSLFPEKQPQRQFSLPYHFQADSSSPRHKVVSRCSELTGREQVG